MSTHKSTGKNPEKNFDMTQDSLKGDGVQPVRVINSGDRLTIETIEDFAQQIRDGLAAANTVVIEFAGDVDLDITALQLFCSACKTATAMKKKFIHRGPLPQSLKNLAEAAGMEHHDSCQNNNMSCFRHFGGIE